MGSSRGNFIILAAFVCNFTYGIEAEKCPETVKAWGEWREKIVNRSKPSNWMGFGKFLTECRSQPEQKKFFEDEALVACLSPLTNAIYASSAMNDLKDNPLIKFTSEEYRDSKRLDFPQMNQLLPELESEEFSKWVSDVSPVRDRDVTYKRWDGMQKVKARLARMKIENPELKVVQRNDHFLVLLPGEDYDRYFNIEGETILILAIQKRNSKHEELDPPLKYYNVFSTKGEKDKRLRAHLRSPMHCERCHQASGGIALLRETDSIGNLKPLDPEARPSDVDFMNKRIEQTANAVSPDLDPRPFGPAMGPIRRESRTLEFVKSCANKEGRHFPDERLELIQDAMSCATCHHGRKRKVGKMAGVLRAPMGNGNDFDTGMINGVVHSGHMPPQSDPRNRLKPDELKALARCVREEYYGGLVGFGKEPGIYKTYLLGKACPTSLGTAGKPHESELPPNDTHWLPIR